MNIERKQEVRSFGIISLVCLVGAFLMLSLPIFNERLGSQDEGTLRRAESLAYQVLESRRVHGRGPASATEGPSNHLVLDEGEIGSDTWGKPFQFKLLKQAQTKNTRVLVWSLGPNGKAETSTNDLDLNRDKEKPEFQGDDLGVMVLVK